MAQSVVYADLKFATAPPLTDPACPAVPDEDESPYENVPLGPVPAAPSPGRWPQRWLVPTRLLAASLLLLLLVVATVALGACCESGSKQGQCASRRSCCPIPVSQLEQSLQQTRVELAWARAELQKAWQDGNSSRLELESLTTNLEHVLEVLGKTEKEMQEVQEKLNNSESTVAILRSCVNTECCPPRWVLYRGKCLFISAEENSWWDSREDCRRKSAQLLVQGTWLFWTLPHFVQTRGATYLPERDCQIVMINLKGYKRSCIKRTVSSPSARTSYSKINNSYRSKNLRWTCKKSPNLSSPSETLFPLQGLEKSLDPSKKMEHVLLGSGEMWLEAEERKTGLGKLGDRSLLMLGGEKVSPAAGKEGDTPRAKEAAMLNRPGGPMNQRLDSSQRCVLAVAEPNDTPGLPAAPPFPLMASGIPHLPSMIWGIFIAPRFPPWSHGSFIDPP
ncbi:uncharacterized protein LOC142365738 [Opisthocomus hoazin]|uniref:uncharacterized protein LOC142365738 n=1 Tax=Opisthocomus hoazin TaxID=30419 RepID=UPI003F5313A7